MYYVCNNSTCMIHYNGIFNSGSPASCSQLKVGDEIIAVNSIPVAVGEETSERIKKVSCNV